MSSLPTSPDRARAESPRRRPGAAVAASGDTPGPTVVSVNVGMPKDVSWNGRTVHTGIEKRPVRGPAMVRRLNIDGDGQGDLGGHGGEQRAVLVYQTGSYTYWQSTSGGTTSATAGSGRTSPSTGCPTTRSASATGTGSERPSSRSPSRG